MDFYRQVGPLGRQGRTFASTKDSDNQEVFKRLPIGSMGSQHGLLDALKQPCNSFFMSRLQTGLGLYNDHFQGMPPIHAEVQHDKQKLINQLVDVASSTSIM